MKRISLALLTICLLAFSLVGCNGFYNPPSTSTVVYGNLEYKRVEENGKLVGYEVTGLGTYSSNNVLIPEAYMDMPVIGIGDNAFAGLTQLNSIDMYSSVKYIGNDAFANCTELKTIGLSKNITEIGSNCFSGCYMLNYNVYKNGKYLGNDANPYMVFINCVNAENFELHENTKLIYSLAFAHSDIESVNLPKNVMSFSGFDFLDCKKLTSITVDSENAVYSASNNAVIRKEDNALVLALDSVDLSTISAEKILGYAFANWNKTDPITISSVVTSLDDNAFAYGKFSGVNLSASIQEIGMGIFYSCSNLATIGDFTGENYYCKNNCIIDIINKSVLAGCKNSVIPTESNVTLIDNSAFFYCVGLKEITIPENIVKIDEMAFYWCTSLEKINFSNNLKIIGKNAFSLCSSLKSITLNEGLRRLDKGAFSSSSIETVSIPSTVEYIEENAFRNCTKLKTVYYALTKEDFLKISMSEGNEALFTAEQVFNQTIPA